MNKFMNNCSLSTFGHNTDALYFFVFFLSCLTGDVIVPSCEADTEWAVPGQARALYQGHAFKSPCQKKPAATA